MKKFGSIILCLILSLMMAFSVSAADVTKVAFLVPEKVEEETTTSKLPEEITTEAQQENNNSKGGWFKRPEKETQPETFTPAETEPATAEPITESETTIPAETEPETTEPATEPETTEEVMGGYGFIGEPSGTGAFTNPVINSLGIQKLENIKLDIKGQTAVQNSGTATLILRNSYIHADTDEETKPLDGNPGNLLIGGNLRGTLGLDQSQNFYINSTIISKNWAALSTDAAKPATGEGQKELTLYAYGSDAKTEDGGYGAYSDIFCNFCSFGSRISAAEIGIISGTYGKVTVGTIGDGEENEELSAILTETDKELRPDKDQPSIIEGGRNALMIHSVNLPPYWEYEGYSEEEIPQYSTEVKAEGSIFATDMALDKNLEYETQKQAFIDHVKGSVFLIKSTNAEIRLEDCELKSDENGTGYVIQTVFNNDTMFMNSVPDGETYSGVKVLFKDMKVDGSLSHEDYQRDFTLTLEAAELNGDVCEHSFAEWATVATKEGFTDYWIDKSYKTHHGVSVELKDASVWTVQEVSRISNLSIGDGCQVVGDIYLDGELQNPDVKELSGKIVIVPGGVPLPEDPGVIEIEEAEEKTTEEETTTEAETAHIHNWQSNGGYPPNCTEDGAKWYICYECGSEYSEAIPAMGHDMVWNSYKASTCESHGYDEYICSRCGYQKYDYYDFVPHDMQLTLHVAPTCTIYGYDEYTCSYCGQKDYDYYDATGHNWVIDYHEPPTCTTDGYYAYYCTDCWDTYTEPSGEPATGHSFIYYPTPGAESITHTIECMNGCGYYSEEIHWWDDPCVCGFSGPRG